MTDQVKTAVPAKFEFNLDERVHIARSCENGNVRARAEWTTGNVSYHVAYSTHHGEYREAWIDESELRAGSAPLNLR